MIRPSAFLALLFGIGAVVSLILTLLDPANGLLAVWLLVALALMTVVDALRALKPGQMKVTHQTPTRIMLGKEAYLDLFCDFSGEPYPKTFAAVDLDGVFRPVEESRFEVTEAGVRIPLAATRRGTGEIPKIRTRWYSPFRLVFWQVEEPCKISIPVIPNTGLVEEEALTFQDRDAWFGIKPQRQQGEGTEFEALREFVTGLDPRSIDWKHSAKHRELLCKQFEVERNHQVILAFDTGHLMSAEIEGLAKIDHAINSGLVLAYRTLKSGDRVGVFAFDSLVRDYLAPTSGPQTMALVRDRLAGLEYSTDETNFTLGLSTLLGQLNRRSLVIVFTDFVDTITAEIMTENLKRVSKHHLVLFVTLTDGSLEEVFQKRPENFDEVTRAVVAGEFITERRSLLKRLKQLGIQTLESPSAGLASKLVAQYLFIKERELI